MTATFLIPFYIIFGTCCQVLATPPDIINVRDEFFGVSESKLFVLRITYDNLGLHDSEQRDAVLVALDRQTQEETYWPVYRARRIPDYERDETGVINRVDPLALPYAVDPFEILSEFDGMPVGTKGAGHDVVADVKIKDGAVLITYGDGSEFRSDMGTLSQRLTASLNALADTLGDYDRLAPIRTRDLLGDLMFQPDQCHITELRRFDVPLGDMPTLVARLTCDDEEGQVVSLLALVPPVT